MYHGEIIETITTEQGETVYKVLIWSTVEDTPASMADVNNLDDDIKLAVGSAFLYPDGGAVHFWLSDDAWHLWNGDNI